MLILSGLAALIAMARAGIRAFWAAPDRTVPRVRVIEMAPVAVLIILCGIQTIQAGPVMRYMRDNCRGASYSPGLRPRRAAAGRPQASGADGT